MGRGNGDLDALLSPQVNTGPSSRFEEWVPPAGSVTLFEAEESVPERIKLPSRALLLLGGPLGCGKTTLAKRLGLGDALLEIDDFQSMPEGAAFDAIAEKIGARGHCAIDAPAVFKNQLNKYSSLCEEMGVPLFALYTAATEEQIERACVRRGLDGRAFHSYEDGWRRLREQLESGSMGEDLRAEWVGVIPGFEQHTRLRSVRFLD